MTFEVQITVNDMFDYNIYHNYRNFQGILSLILGVIMLVLCGAAIIQDGNISYILITGFFGLFFTIITPVRIYFKSMQQVKLTPFFRKPIKYTLTAQELTIEQGDEKAVISMENIVKAVETGKSIILYVNSVRAYILPKRELGENVPKIKEIIKNSKARKVKF